MDRESIGRIPFCSSAPQGLPHRCLTLNCGWVLLGVGTLPLPKPPLRGAGPLGPAFTFAPPSLPPTPSGPMGLEGASVGRGSGPGSQQLPRGPSGQGECWPCSLLILCPPNGPLLSPSGCGIPSPSPAAPQGCRTRPASTSPPPSLPPRPTRLLGVPPVPLGVRGPPPVPGRCPSCVET